MRKMVGLAFDQGALTHVTGADRHGEVDGLVLLFYLDGDLGKLLRARWAEVYGAGGALAWVGDGVMAPTSHVFFCRAKYLPVLLLAACPGPNIQ